MLKKFEARGMLKSILPFDKIPDAKDLNSIKNLITLSLSPAEKRCKMDLLESQDFESEEKLDAFRTAFINRLRLLLLTPTQ